MKKLNDRQRIFCDLVLAGTTYADAYRRAGYRATTEDAVQACSSRLAALPSVRAYLDKERQRLEKASELSRDQFVALLSSVVASPGEFPRAQAAGLLARLMGWDSPVRVESSADHQVTIVWGLPVGESHQAVPEGIVAVEAAPIRSIEPAVVSVDPLPPVQVTMKTEPVEEAPVFDPGPLPKSCSMGPVDIGPPRERHRLPNRARS